MWKVLVSLAVVCVAWHAMAQHVLVLPMDQIGGDASQGFVAQALVQGICSEVDRTGGGTGVAGAGTGAHFKAVRGARSAADARAAGKEAGADYVVSGVYQINQNELRVTGQVTNVRTNALAGPIKVTGQLRDLFTIEDEVAGQVKRALGFASHHWGGDAAGKRIAPRSSPAVRCEWRCRR